MYVNEIQSVLGCEADYHANQVPQSLLDPKRSFVGNKIPKGDSETINWSDLSMNTKPKEDELNSHEDS